MIIKTAIRSFLGGGTLPIILVAVALGVFVTGYTKGRIVGSQKSLIRELTKAKEELAADRDRLSQQIEGANKALRLSQVQSDLDAETIKTLKGKADAFDAKLGPKNDRFILSHDDVGILSGN